MAWKVTLQPIIWPHIDQPLKIVDRARAISLPLLNSLYGKRTNASAKAYHRLQTVYLLQECVMVRDGLANLPECFTACDMPDIASYLSLYMLIFCLCLCLSLSLSLSLSVLYICTSCTISIIIIITRKRGNCGALQLEASRSAVWPPPPAHPSGKLSCPKSALGPV